MYDLLIKGGTVIDPSQNINGPNDVAVQDGKIALVAPDIAESEAARVVEVKGKLVTPGLIDLHTHIYDGVNGNGVEADLGGVRAGVTTNGGRRQFRVRHLRRLPAPHHPQQRHGDYSFPAHPAARDWPPRRTFSAPPALTWTGQIQVVGAEPGHHLRHQGPHGVPGPGDYGHGNAPQWPSAPPWRPGSS